VRTGSSTRESLFLSYFPRVSGAWLSPIVRSGLQSRITVANYIVCGGWYEDEDKCCKKGSDPTMCPGTSEAEALPLLTTLREKMGIVRTARAIVTDAQFIVPLAVLLLGIILLVKLH
jgi:hypothetical protein